MNTIDNVQLNEPAPTSLEHVATSARQDVYVPDVFIICMKQCFMHMLRPNRSVLQLAHDYQVLPKGQQTGTSPASLVRVTTTALCCVRTEHSVNAYCHDLR
jgi:hypothetical protein